MGGRRPAWLGPTPIVGEEPSREIRCPVAHVTGSGDRRTCGRFIGRVPDPVVPLMAYPRNRNRGDYETHGAAIYLCGDCGWLHEVARPDVAGEIRESIRARFQNVA